MTNTFIEFLFLYTKHDTFGVCSWFVALQQENLAIEFFFQDVYN